MNTSALPTAAVEPLEPRLAPAGTVLISTAGGILNITGDAADNAIAITDVPGSGTWEISDPAGSFTTFILNGTNMGMSPFQIPVQKSIKASLGDSTDRFDLVPAGGASAMFLSGTLNLDAGKGDDTINLGSSTAQQLLIGGAVTVKLGDGMDGLAINSSVVLNGAVSIQGGAGNDDISLTNGATHVFQKGLSVDLGAGADSFRAASTRFQILGATSIKGAGQVGATQVIDLVPDSGLCEGNVTIAISAGNLDSSINFFASDVFRFGGGLVINGAGGDDSLSFGGTTNVAGALAIDLKSGDNDVTLGSGRSLQAGSLTVKGGTGADTLLLDSTSILQLTGALKIDLGAGTNVFDVNAGHNLTAAAFAYTGAAGADTVSFDGANLSILGSSTFALGAGTNSLDLAPTVSAFIGGSLSITGGAGNDSVSINSPLARIHGNFTQSLGDGINTATAAGALLHVSGTVSYSGGKGNDSFQFSNDSLILNRALNFTPGTGTGSDLLYLQVMEGTVGSVSYKGGASSDQLWLGNTNGTGTTRLAILSSVNASLGAGAASANITDTVIHGSLTFAASSTAAQSDALSISDSTINGTAVVGMGAGSSTLSVNDSVLHGAFTANLGAGADSASLDTNPGSAGPTQWFGVVRILAGAGIDTITIGSALLVPDAANHFYKNVFVDGGADADVYSAGNNTMFAGSVITTSNIP